jgi:uncharacterized protein (TIGR03083 family)
VYNQSMQKPTPILVVDRFPAVLDALLDLLSGLSEEEWSRPTAAAGWSVKDIALHLLGDEISILSGKRDGFSEKSERLETWDELVAFLNTRNAAWVQAARRISPQLLCELLRFTGERANALFRSLDMDALGGAVSWAGPEPAPVWLDVAREFTERWHHQQHIRDAVGKPGCTGPFFLRPVLEAFMFGLPQAYRQVVAPEGTCVTLAIVGPSGGFWSLLREGERWQLYLGRPDQPAAEIVMPEDTAWRLFTRGLSKGQARQYARLLGDLELAEKALETVSIIA